MFDIFIVVTLVELFNSVNILSDVCVCVCVCIFLINIVEIDLKIQNSFFTSNFMNIMPAVKNNSW